MLNIFKKKPPKLELVTTQFILVFNLSGIKKFIEKPFEINAKDFKEHIEDCVEYKITMLPNDTGCFYHQAVGEMSSFIDGVFPLETANSDSNIYWGMNALNFNVWIDSSLTKENPSIFWLSSSEIIAGIKNERMAGDPLNPSELMKGYEVATDNDEIPKHRRVNLSPTTIFSNELVKLSIIPLNRTTHHVFYPNINK